MQRGRRKSEGSDRVKQIGPSGFEARVLNGIHLVMWVISDASESLRGDGGSSSKIDLPFLTPNSVLKT